MRIPGAALVVLLAACSSSSTTASSLGPPSCETVAAPATGLSASCDCVFLAHPYSSRTANTTACSVASTGTDSICHYSALTSADGPDDDAGCTCFSFACDEDAAHTSVNCGYFRSTDGRAAGTTVSVVAESACVGQHYCFTSSPSVCQCQDAPCASGAQELTSCTDANARAMLEVHVVMSGEVAVSDCRDPSTTTGS